MVEGIIDGELFLKGRFVRPEFLIDESACLHGLLETRVTVIRFRQSESDGRSKSVVVVIADKASMAMIILMKVFHFAIVHFIILLGRDVGLAVASSQ